MPDEPTEVAEVLSIPEIETEITEPTLEKSPTPRPISRPPVATEYASPVFVKRSRASYGPLFELFDEELEEDGGRKGKGRKRPRYSVERGRWRYREESSSPEPEASPEAPTATEKSNHDSTTQSTPAKPQMTDGGCQTNDFELPPPPSTSFNTPLKRWGNAENSPLFAMGLARAAAAPRMDMGVQASPSMSTAQYPNAAAAPDTRAPSAIAASYPGLFGTPRQSERPLADAASPFAQMQTPTQSAFPQSTHAGPGFESGSSPSVGFRFGQPPPQAAPDAPPFARSQAPDQPYNDHPYPESYLADDEPTDLAPTMAHNPFSLEARPHPYAHQEVDNAPGFSAQHSHTAPYWTTATSTDPALRQVHLAPVSDGHSDDSMREKTPPGTVPPHVEDGTRNQDKMRKDGLLSRPVYRQDVPKEALPDDGDASAGDEDDSMDSDELAAYDEEDKGDDYDLRNYDRLSDDEEGYEDEEPPLPEGELLDEDEEEYGDEEGDYDDEEGGYDDDEEYEEEGYDRPNQYAPVSRFPTQQPPQTAPPKAPAEPVVIDLLSDSDDDEPPPPPKPRIQEPPHTNAVHAVPVRNTMNHLAQESEPLTTSEPDYNTSEDEQEEQESELEEDADVGGLDGQEDESDGEEVFSEEDEEEPDDAANEPENDDAAEDVISVERTQVTVVTTSIVSDMDRGAASDPDEISHSDEIHDANESGGVDQKDQVTETQTSTEERHESVMESFQTQPADVLASFETRTSETPRSSRTGSQDSEIITRPESEQDEVRVDDEEEGAKLKQDDILDDDDQENGIPDKEPQGKGIPERGAIAEESTEEEVIEEEVIGEETIEEEVIDEEALEDISQPLTTHSADPEAATDDEPRDVGSDGGAEQDMVDDTTVQRPAEVMEVDLEDPEDELLDPESARSAEGQASLDKPLIDASNEEQDVPPTMSDLQRDGIDTTVKVDTSITSVMTSHIDTQPGDTPQITSETQETKFDASQPTIGVKDIAAVVDEEDKVMMDTEPPQDEDDGAEMYNASSPFREDVDMADVEVPDEGGINAEKPNETHPSPSKEEMLVDTIATAQDEDLPEETDDMPMASNMDEEEDERDVDMKAAGSKSPSPGEDHIHNSEHNVATNPSSPQQMSTQDDEAIQSSAPVSMQLDGAQSDEGEEFHDVSEIPEAETFSPIIPYDENSSFMTANSEVSEMHDSEGTEPTSTAKRKRSGRKRDDLSINFKRSKRPATDLSPSRQRTTRSKAMSFQSLSSPRNDKEDMSIQLARAAIKSPTKRKASSAKSTSRPKSNLVKRLADEMPECVPLRDLKKYNKRTLDVAVVATSALTPPKRTPVREYVSSLTVTDPSLSDSVIEVTIFSLHRDHFPVVNPGDSILLRSFTVKALPERGWGLNADNNISSWAVFEAGGNNEPQMRAAPVELSDEESKYLLDLRGWYGSLDGDAKDRLGKAVGKLIDKGREHRGEK